MSTASGSIEVRGAQFPSKAAIEMLTKYEQAATFVDIDPADPEGKTRRLASYVAFREVKAELLMTLTRGLEREPLVWPAVEG